MKSRRLILGVVIGVVVLGVAGILLDPTYTARGYLLGESFYKNRPVSYWHHALMSSDPVTEENALQAMKEGGKSAVPLLCQLVSGKNSSGADTAEVRWKAADLLGQVGPEAREGAEALIGALKDDDTHVRTVAATSLGLIAAVDPSKEVVSALSDLVKSGGTPAIAAARALSRFGGKAVAAIPVLLDALKDENPEVRWNAARTLGKMKASAKSAVPNLVAGLKDKEPKVREHCAEALGDIGPEAKDAVPDLIAVLKDPNSRVRRDATRSLGQIGPAAKAALPELQKLTKDENADVRKAAATAIRILETTPGGKQ